MLKSKLSKNLTIQPESAIYRSMALKNAQSFAYNTFLKELKKRKELIKEEQFHACFQYWNLKKNTKIYKKTEVSELYKLYVESISFSNYITKTVPIKSYINFHTLVVEIQGIRFSTKEKKSPLKVKIETPPIFIYTDPFLLKIILLSLIEMASHGYEEDDGFINLRAERKSNILKIEIEDQGFYLPLSLRKQIYCNIYKGGAFKIAHKIKISIETIEVLVQKAGLRMVVRKSDKRRGSLWIIEIPLI